MEGLGAAANIIAVIDLSAKVATLCFQYSKDVSSAREDIERLCNQVEHLASALRAAQRLVEGTRGSSLTTSQQLVGSFRSCIADLGRVEKKLAPSPLRTNMRRYGIRALKWPFNSKEVDQLLASLDCHERTILLGLQVDQTAILVDINEGVKQLGLRGTEHVSISRKPHLMVPFTPNPDFIHRPEIEKWIQDQYRQPGQRMALVGMGGFGKSQLAINFAHEVYAKETGTSVFWVHSSSKPVLEESYRALADVLALPRRHEPEVDVPALVRDWLQRDDVCPWLMVVDNADDINLFKHDSRDDNASQGTIASYLPKSIKGKILVTSRSLDVAERLVGSSRAILRIPIMGEEQALELLQARLEDKVDEATAMNLVRTLDHIPLAINQAAAYINRRSPQVTVKSYLGEICRSEKRKDSLLRSDKGDLGRQDGVSNSVVLTWQVTFDQIKRDQPRAAGLLSLMSQFQAQNIPEFMLHNYDDGTKPDEENDANSISTRSESDGESERICLENDMDVLRGYSLVTIAALGRYEMHSLVQFCTRSWTSEFGGSARWSRLFTKLVADHFPAGEFDTWAVCQSLLPHIEDLLERKPREESNVLDWTEILTKVSWYMLKIGKYSRAELLAETAVQARRCILGHDHADTLTSMNNLALAYRNQGRWKEAETLHAKVMETRKVKLGLDHTDTLTSVANLASTFWNQGRWEEAEKLEVEVVEAYKVKLGLDHPDTLTSMSNLATTYWNQRRWDEAEKLNVEVMDARTATLGLNHPDTLTNMAHLAIMYGDQGRWEETENLQVKVVEALGAMLGLDHPDTLTAKANLALTFWNQGQLKQAELLGTEVVEAQKVTLGVDHPDTLNSMFNLAYTKYNLGELQDCLDSMQRCFHLCQQKLGNTHPLTELSIATLQSWQI